MASKEQFRIQLEPDMIQEMERLAGEFGLRSAATVGAEIIVKYLPLWIDLKRAERELHRKQRATLLKELGGTDD